MNNHKIKTIWLNEVSFQDDINLSFYNDIIRALKNSYNSHVGGFSKDKHSPVYLETCQYAAALIATLKNPYPDLYLEYSESLSEYLLEYFLPNKGAFSCTHSLVQGIYAGALRYSLCESYTISNFLFDFSSNLFLDIELET